MMQRGHARDRRGRLCACCRPELPGAGGRGGHRAGVAPLLWASCVSLDVSDPSVSPPPHEAPLSAHGRVTGGPCELSHLHPLGWGGGGERFGSISRVHAAFDFVIPQPGIIQGKPDEPEADSRVRGSNRGFTYDAGGPEIAQRAEGGGWAPRLRAQTRERCAATAVS